MVRDMVVQTGLPSPNPAFPSISMPSLTDRAWSSYLAGILIELLQIPAFLLLDRALSTSSSYVTVGASLAALANPGTDSAAKHLTGAENWWQVAVVAGIALGAFGSAPTVAAAGPALHPRGAE
jgi:hypothetical protein